MLQCRHGTGRLVAGTAFFIDGFGANHISSGLSTPERVREASTLLATMVDAELRQLRVFTQQWTPSRTSSTPHRFVAEHTRKHMHHLAAESWHGRHDPGRISCSRTSGTSLYATGGRVFNSLGAW